MKKFITILVSGSLALAASAMAQEPEQSPGTGKKEKAAKTETTPTGQETGRAKGKGKAAGNAETNANPNATGGTSPGATEGKQKGARNRVRTENATANQSASPGATVNPQENVGKGKRGKNARTEGATANQSASPGATVNAQENVGKGKRGKNARTATQAASPTPAASATPATSVNPATANQSASMAPSASAAPSASVAASAQAATNATANQTNVNAGANANAGTNTGQIKGKGKNGKQVDQQMVQKIKTEHASFRAQPRPDRAPAVTFNANFRLAGAEQWQGPKYEVFRSYHPERHDRVWFSSHHFRVELISGGYYYWNNGYWYPAWGYDPSAEYYAYDAPIYVGQHAERRPDQVIADVQAALQEMGYYQGEVDGLLGPLTRQALTEYQNDNGLYATATIDEPTLQSLDLG